MLFHRKQYSCRKLNLLSLSSFEGLCCRLSVDGGSVIILSIYRPPGAATTLFYDELSIVLESLVVHGCPVLIGGDLNIHVECQTDKDAVRLADLLASFDMVQHVHSPTHQRGGTLDLVITFSDCKIENIDVDPAGVISDHGLVTCTIPAQQVVNVYSYRVARSWRSVGRPSFRDAVRASPVGSRPPSSSSASELFEIYNSELRRIANRFAPAHTVRSRVRPLALWFDSECRAIRRNCRRLERRYRRTKNSVDRAAWTKAVRQKHVDFSARKSQYWMERLNNERSSPSKLWKSLSKVFCRDDNTTASTNVVHTAEEFLRAFEEKVASVRAKTDGFPPAEVESISTERFSGFRTCTEEEIRRVVMQSPTKSCTLDPIPTFMLKESIDVLLPFLTAMCNASLSEGVLPLSQRHAIVTPLLKKPSLDPAELKNYRPVSNLSFVSKIVEKLVSDQLVSHLQSNNLMPRLQSAYRRHHSTETALLRVVSDLLRAADNKKVTLLGLLDLSAAFDCVDHAILLQRLTNRFGIVGTALDWIKSFLSDRTQQVSYNHRLSSVGHLICGVPQGSVLGPLMFVLYTAELFDLIEACGLTAHSYADDTQIYLSVPAVDASTAVQRFTLCVERIEAWMGANRLKLNTEKTQVIWIGTRQQLSKIDITELRLGSATVPVSNSVSDLGVMVDSQLTMADHVATTCRSCFFQLRQLRSIRLALTIDATKTLVNAFISSRLDYCNSLLAGISSGLLKKLQSVQNAAARLISRTRKFDHITPVLRDLHWLPIRKRIDFKIATLVFKCLHDLAPPYLVGDIVPLASIPGRRLLRSSSTQTLSVPFVRTANYGSRCFAVYGPTVWNSLPVELRTADCSLATFRQRLKTYFFLADLSHFLRFCGTGVLRGAKVDL